MRQVDTEFLDLVNRDGAFDLIANSAAQGSEGISANVLSPREFCEFEELKIFNERLDEFKVGVHSFVVGVVVATELASDKRH